MSAISKPPPFDFAAARFHMVESQLRPNRVRDERILSTMGDLPREMFVPPQMAGIAYIDADVQVAPSRYLLKPMVLARLLEEAGIKSGDRALDIASATGYSTAVLAAMAGEVTAVESDEALQKQAVANLSALHIASAKVCGSSFVQGWKDTAPYDIILINGCIEILPDALAAQLAEGGRLVAVVRQYGPAHAAHTGEARLYEKVRGALSHRALFDANVELLPGFAAIKTFTF